MAFLDYIELVFGWLFASFRAHDVRLFTNGPAFASHPTPTITLTSPSCGPSGSILQPKFTQIGEDLFPELIWGSCPEPEIKEYILICEDADMPLPGPIAQRVFHGLFYSIPASLVGVSASDFEIVRRSEDGKGGEVKGGFRFSRNVRGGAYVGPKPVLGHGKHRYFYQLVALREPLDLGRFGGGMGKGKLAREIEGMVVGWGVWVGVFERRWGERG